MIFLINESLTAYSIPSVKSLEKDWYPFPKLKHQVGVDHAFQFFGQAVTDIFHFAPEKCIS